MTLNLFNQQPVYILLYFFLYTCIYTSLEDIFGFTALCYKQILNICFKTFRNLVWYRIEIKVSFVLYFRLWQWLWAQFGPESGQTGFYCFRWLSVFGPRGCKKFEGKFQKYPLGTTGRDWWLAGAKGCSDRQRKSERKR